eukprot:CAMPEP_0170175328 /NCGR_PEP_ID=MMETSP0040_2-20121228/8415_1 /TAXON_ID=641309 /ORGANISM="Lotharella oceanica, Strain CCMP622" /LENGTH=69 /DNA_ID=CAMNT_0010417269 /DNA_START=40 /DNA_END=249 /DNA_ORIENTATION=+
MPAPTATATTTSLKGYMQSAGLISYSKQHKLTRQAAKAESKGSSMTTKPIPNTVSLAGALRAARKNQKL